MRYILENDDRSSWSRVLADFAFVSYFCMPFERIIVNRLNYLHIESLTYVALFIISFFPAFIAMCINTKRLIAIKEFGILFFGLISTLAITLVLHPDYIYWYSRDTYGVIPYVFRPQNGIYAFFFIRLIDDPDRILKDLRISGSIMYVFFLWRFMIALKNGYWNYESSTGEMIKISYSLDFGYDVMLFAIPFIYLAFSEHKIWDIIASILGVVMCFAAGSRGPILILGLFICCCVLKTIGRSKWGAVYGPLIVVIVILLSIFSDRIVNSIKSILIILGVKSRTLEMFLNGTMSSDSGRNVYWETAIRMIKEKPIFGYGAMGARPVLSAFHVAAYPHQLFLELIVEYGVFGVCISLLLLIGSIRVFLMRDIGKWKAVFAIFFANALELMLSYTYWHKYALWAALAAGICAISFSRKKMFEAESFGKREDYVAMNYKKEYKYIM